MTELKTLIVGLEPEIVAWLRDNWIVGTVVDNIHPDEINPGDTLIGNFSVIVAAEFINLGAMVLIVDVPVCRASGETYAQHAKMWQVRHLMLTKVALHRPEMGQGYWDQVAKGMGEQK